MKDKVDSIHTEPNIVNYSNTDFEQDGSSKKNILILKKDPKVKFMEVLASIIYHIWSYKNQTSFFLYSFR